MRLLLPRKDVLHAVGLRWEMISHDPRWCYTSYEVRAALRVRHDEYARSVFVTMQGAPTTIYDLDPDLVSYAKRSIRKQLFNSYILSLGTVGVFAGLAGLVLVEIVVGWWRGTPDTEYGAPVNPAYVIILTWPLGSIFPAALIAWLRGAWRTYRLIRHARRARGDQTYLLPEG